MSLDRHRVVDIFSRLFPSVCLRVFSFLTELVFTGLSVLLYVWTEVMLCFFPSVFLFSFPCSLSSVNLICSMCLFFLPTDLHGKGEYLCVWLENSEEETPPHLCAKYANVMASYAPFACGVVINNAAKGVGGHHD